MAELSIFWHYYAVFFPTKPVSEKFQVKLWSTGCRGIGNRSLKDCWRSPWCHSSCHNVTVGHCRYYRALSITGGGRVATGYDRSGLGQKRVLNLGGGGYSNLVWEVSGWKEGLELPLPQWWMFWLSRTAIDWGRMPLDHMLATIYYHLYCYFVHSDHHDKNDHRMLDNVGPVLFLTAFSAIKENAANQRRLSWKLTLRSEWRSTHSIFPLSRLNETYLAVFDRPGWVKEPRLQWALNRRRARS